MRLPQPTLEMLWHPSPTEIRRPGSLLLLSDMINLFAFNIIYVCLSVHPSVLLSVCLSVCLSLRLSVSLSLSGWLAVYVCVCVCIYIICVNIHVCVCSGLWRWLRPADLIVNKATFVNIGRSAPPSHFAEGMYSIIKSYT